MYRNHVITPVAYIKLINISIDECIPLMIVADLFNTEREYDNGEEHRKSNYEQSILFPEDGYSDQ